MRVLTPTVKRSNRSDGIVSWRLAVLIMFVVGLYAVGVLHIQAPIQEFNSVDTMAALTRDIIAAPAVADLQSISAAQHAGRRQLSCDAARRADALSPADGGDGDSVARDAAGTPALEAATDGLKQVLVVGAGPSGISSAYYLEQAGIPYRVVDRAA